MYANLYGFCTLKFGILRKFLSKEFLLANIALSVKSLYITVETLRVYVKKNSKNWSLFSVCIISGLLRWVE